MKFPVLLLLLTASLIGCDSKQSLPPFTTSGDRGKPVELQLFTDEAGRYLLKDPAVAVRSNQAFYLRYRGGGLDSTLRVLGADNRQIAAKALPRSGEATVYLPLKRGQIVQGFQIDPASALPVAAASGVSAADHLELLEAGISESVGGLKQSGRLLTVGTAVERLDRDGLSMDVAVSDPESWPVWQAADARPNGPQPAGTQTAEARPGDSGAFPVESGISGWRITIVLESRPPFSLVDFRLREYAAGMDRASKPPGTSEEGSGNAQMQAADPAGRTAVQRSSLLIRIRSGDDSVSFRHTALPGRRSIYLYHGLAPFTPESLRLEPEGGGAVWLDRLEIAGLPPGTAPAVHHPLPADPGTVLAYDPKAWRRPQYELFSWSRFPEILIMDTASYALQSLFFKRLAFFVEKRGYRGRLVSNEEFAGLHGFNAHDYRAEDLARFFQTARGQPFTLNPEEELLKQILLSNGIIRDDGEFQPGKGGILSISRSSYPILRRQLLTHECAHGLFFGLPEFRQASFEAWEQLSDREQDFWKLFFRWVGYDTEDPYLTVNEYQAYLFQQPRSEVGYYFATLTASRLVSSYPSQADWVRELVRTDPDRFTRAFDHLETSLLRIAGVEGGRVIELEPLEKK